MIRTILLLLLLAVPAHAQRQQDRLKWPYCRVFASDGSAGSGVLVDVNETEALVITNQHVISDCDGSVLCRFLSGQACSGKVLSCDKYRNDLAALVIERPTGVEPINLDRFDGRSPHYTLCGFGPGNFMAQRGRYLGAGGTPRGASYQSATFSFSARSGDSGGAIIDADGELVGLVWGNDNGTSYAVCGNPVHEYLIRLTQCQGGNCWNGYYYRPQGRPIVTQPQSPPPTQEPTQPAPRPQAPDWEAQFSAFSAEIRAEIATLRDECESSRCQCDPSQMVGPPGKPGADGRDGKDGQDGRDAPDTETIVTNLIHNDQFVNVLAVQIANQLKDSPPEPSARPGKLYLRAVPMD